MFTIRKNYKLKGKIKEIKEKIIFVFLFHCQVNGMGKSSIYRIILNIVILQMLIKLYNKSLFFILYSFINHKQGNNIIKFLIKLI